MNSTVVMEGNETSLATTNMNAENNMVVNDLVKSEYNTQLYVHKDATISDFLSKPYLVWSGAWDIADVANTQKTANDIAPFLSSVTYWKNKIEGFNLIRGTAVVRVNINANPFHQGKLLLHFLPCANDFYNYSTNYAGMHNANIVTKTMQPNVELDCRESSCEMRIPYCTPTDFYDMKAGVYDWGAFYLTVLTPLLTGGSGESTVDVTIYLHFEDVELAAPIVPQGPSGGKRFSTRKISPGEREAAASATGPLSRALRVTSEIAGAVSQIPILSGVASTVSWVADAMSGIASHFGYAKPQIDKEPTRTVAMNNPFMATGDGVDTSYPLSASVANKVQLMDNFSHTNEDEMSFNFLYKVKALTNIVNWAYNQTEGTSLVSLNISPNSLNVGGTSIHNAHTATWKTGPPIFYLAQQFLNYRGSFELTIKIAKTDFHTGRLQITWSPYDNVTTNPTALTGIVSLREIIDIKSGSEIKLVLPYISRFKYLPTSTPSGTLDIVVLNELRAPETCANNVNMLLYFNGGEDFEFSVPGSKTFANICPFYPQMDDRGLVDHAIGNEEKKKLSLEAASLCVGEAFSSIRTFLSRYTHLYTSKASFTGGTDVLNLWPNGIGITSIDVATGVITGADLGGDAFSLLAPMFAFYRGSSRIAFSTNASAFFNNLMATNSPNCAELGNKIIDNQSGSWFQSGSSYALANASALSGYSHCDAASGVFSYSLPYYCRSHCSLALCQHVANATIPTTYDQPRSTLVVGSSVGTVSNIVFTRSFQDDFQLGYFIGCPPLLTGWV